MKDDEFERVPSLSEVRRRVRQRGPRIGTGWPVLDDITGGLPGGRTTLLCGPQEVRLQVLARTAAWSAGEGYSTLIASRSVTTEELWLAVCAGGLGLPSQALLTTSSYDDWIDARMRVLDLQVIGDHDAPERTAAALAKRGPAVLIIDDYLQSQEPWNSVLSTHAGGRDLDLDLQVTPRRMGCTLVLGSGSMDLSRDMLDRVGLTVRLVPDDDLSRIRCSAYQGLTTQHRMVPLRDGFLEPPALGQLLIHRPGIENLWLEKSKEDISAFTRVLGAEATELVWDPDEAGGGAL